MNRTFQRIALLCLCAWVSSPCRGQFLEGMRQAMANAETDIAFYGMVVDQYESPVVGAEVTLDLLQSSSLTESGMSISTVRVTTDDAGFFSIQDKRGIQLSIVKIERAGYEFTRTEISQETFVYRKNLAYARGEHGRDVPFVADRAKPIFFHMRKRGATAFLIEGRTWNPQISVRETSGTTGQRAKAKGYDFIRGERIDDVNRRSLNGEPLVCDLAVIAFYDEATTSWTVILAPGNADGGIMSSEELLYEAPDSGYLGEVKFEAEDGKAPQKRYLYLRSRNPAIYSRIEITKVTVTRPDRTLNLWGNRVTNPYGERILDPEPDVTYAVWQQLTDEVRQAFRKNERPAKPDLPALIREAKEKEAAAGGARGR